MRCFVAFSFILVAVNAADDCTIQKDQWMYAGASNGNHRWPQNCPSCDNALEDNFRQSPIDLNSDLVRMGAKPLPKLTFTPDVEDTMGEYVNTVNTLQFNAADSSANTMCGGPLTGEYNFAQVHCHWGRTNYKPEDPTNPPKRVTKQGSEHWIEGVQYDAECHWVHYNNKYDDLGAAVAAGVSGDGEALSVVGVMLDIDDDNKQEDIDWVGALNEAAAGLVTPDDGPAEGPFKVYGFMEQLADPSNCFGYYNYLGGLTTPGCAQIVNWIVVDKPIKINLSQWENVYKMQADDESPKPQSMRMNFRLPQNRDDDGALVGEKRDVTKYVCPPGKVMCHCQSGGSFMELVTPDVIASQMMMGSGGEESNTENRK